MAHVAFVFCCVVWGSMFIVLERVTHVMGPVEIALWRFGGGTAVLAAVWWFAQREYRMTRGELAKIAVVALAFSVPPQLILPYLMGQGFGHSFFGTMVAPIPLITILVSVPLLGVVPTRRQLVGVLGGLACTCLLMDEGFDRGMTLVFVGLTLMIPLSSALSNTIIKWKLARVPAVPLTATILAVSGLSLVPLQFSPPAIAALHLSHTATESVTAMTWLHLFILGVVGTGVSTAVFVWMILVRGPLFAGMTTYVVPVLSLLWGQVDQERISLQQIAAIAGVLTMVALVQSESRRVTSEEPALADAIAEAVAPVSVGAEAQVAVAAAEASVAANVPRALQPESQVA